MLMCERLKKYSYQELMEGVAPIEELVLEHLEWHLTDDDLLDRLAICRDFLEDLDYGDLNDRKYRASLTREQFLLQRVRVEDQHACK
jgi:hypothetical protein